MSAVVIQQPQTLTRDQARSLFILPQCALLRSHVRPPASFSQWNAKRAQSTVTGTDGQWQTLADAQGRVYYYNASTGVTQWERPHELSHAGSLELADVKPVVATAQAVPMTAQAIPVAYATLVQSTGCDLSFLMPLRKLVINQHVKLAEAITGGCIEQANTYTVFNAETGRPVFIVQEISDGCTRCCCAPVHSPVAVPRNT